MENLQRINPPAQPCATPCNDCEVDAAALDLPETMLKGADAGEGERFIREHGYSVAGLASTCIGLIDGLQSQGHSRAAAEAAFERHWCAGRLEVFELIDTGGEEAVSTGRMTYSLSVVIPGRVIISTPTLWRWRDERRRATVESFAAVHVVESADDESHATADPAHRCVRCGIVLVGRDWDHNECHDCRSPKGKLADLDIALRARGDSPDRLSQWPAIRHVLREKFGTEHTAEKLWELFTDLLQAGGIAPREYLVYPLSMANVRHLISVAEGYAHATEIPLERGAEGEPRTPKRKKRSTQPGEAQAKLIAALSKHHKYADEGALNVEPIGNNELAKLAGVDKSTASAFFTKQFNGHLMYKRACADALRLATALKLLNGEIAPHRLYGGTPPGEMERDEE